MRIKLTDSKLRNLPPAPEGKRTKLWDTEVRELVAVVSDKGRVSLMLSVKVPGGRRPVRRLIAHHPSCLVDQARTEARAMLAQVRAGLDPREEKRKRERQTAAETSATFGKLLDEWETRVAKGLRRGREMVRMMRYDLEDEWRSRPVASIDRADVVTAMRRIHSRGAQRVAHNCYRSLFLALGWALNEGTYGMQTHPCEFPRRIQISKILGPLRKRSRVCSDAEIVAWWRASEEMGFPRGPFVKLLLLTGARRNELGDLEWPELDLDKRQWVLPARRHKSARDTLIVLSDAAVEVFRSLPRFRTGQYVFSSSFGAKPISNYGHTGAAHRRLMLKRLGLSEWPAEPPAFHDARRTLRSNLARLKVPFEVAERCLSHKPMSGLPGVYNLWSYEAEMREAMNQYAEFILGLVNHKGAEGPKLLAAE